MRREERTKIMRAAVGLLLALTGCNPLVPEEAARSVSFSRDELPQGVGQPEWWYYNGRVETDDGRVFGIQAVVFHVPPGVVPLLADTWIAHYGVLDQQAGRLIYDQVGDIRPFESNPGFGESGEELAVRTPLIQITGQGAAERLTAVMGDGSHALDLSLTDTRGPIVHGDDGFVPFGLNGGSFYYSRPSMQAGGTLVIGEEKTPVSGELWFDRQWGPDLRNPWLPWDWFSLRLNDGTRIMLYQFRDAQTPAFGTYIPPVGEALTLAGEDVTVAPTRFWTSPRTLRTYPVAWDIRIPSQSLAVSVAATVDDQELEAWGTTLNLYWEGLCDLDGTSGGRAVTGWAYVELTNYAIDWGALGLPWAQGGP
jgi:predicted secreted hydrolase